MTIRGTKRFKWSQTKVIWPQPNLAFENDIMFSPIATPPRMEIVRKHYLWISMTSCKNCSINIYMCVFWVPYRFIEDILTSIDYQITSNYHSEWAFVHLVGWSLKSVAFQVGYNSIATCVKKLHIIVIYYIYTNYRDWNIRCGVLSVRILKLSIANHFRIFRNHPSIICILLSGDN